MANFEAFQWTKKLISNLFFLKNVVANVLLFVSYIYYILSKPKQNPYCFKLQLVLFQHSVFMTKFESVCLYFEHNAGGQFQIVLPEFFYNRKKTYYLENNTHMYTIQCFFHTY